MRSRQTPLVPRPSRTEAGSRSSGEVHRQALEIGELAVAGAPSRGARRTTSWTRCAREVEVLRRVAAGQLRSPVVIAPSNAANIDAAVGRLWVRWALADTLERPAR